MALSGTIEEIRECLRVEEYKHTSLKIYSSNMIYITKH